MSEKSDDIVVNYDRSGLSVERFGDPHKPQVVQRKFARRNLGERTVRVYHRGINRRCLEAVRQEI